MTFLEEDYLPVSCISTPGGLPASLKMGWRVEAGFWLKASGGRNSWQQGRLRRQGWGGTAEGVGQAGQGANPRVRGQDGVCLV